MAQSLPESVVRAGAALGFLTTYGVPTRFNHGPAGRWWESVRSVLSRLFVRVDHRMGPRPITEAEYAGTLDMPPALADEFLWDRGFVRNPLSRLKTLDGNPEHGSWVYRDRPLSTRQIHLMLFETDCARTHVYAHEEASSVNPLVGTDHVNGETQNIARGVEWARRELPLEIRKETPAPPEGPWTDASCTGSTGYRG
jgi:hypothetical protein